MSLANKTIKSSLFILVIRLIQRSIGIVSYLLLARLLTPEDFGIVTIATMLVFLCDVLSESGAQQYIIQKENLSTDDVNTAWTLGIILKSALALVLIIISPFIAVFFELPELCLALQVISLVLPLSALNNPALSILKKHFDYRPFVKLTVYEKVGSFVFTISLALTLQSYWAMILGVVMSYVIKLISSYLITHHKPRLTLINLGEQWDFSKWVLLKAIMGYAKSEFDTVFVSKMFSVETLGGFSMMKNLSTTPGREIIRPLVEPLLASFSKVRSDSVALNVQIIRSISVLLVITTPICAFLLSFDREIVTILFDEKWYRYADLLGIMSIFIVNYSIGSILHEALVSLKKVKFIFYYDALTFATTICLILLLINDGDVEFFTLLRILIAIGSTMLLVLFVKYLLDFSLKDFLIINMPILVSLLFTSLYKVNFTFGNLYIDFIVNSSFFALQFLLIFIGSMFIFRVFPVVRSTQAWAASVVLNFFKNGD